MSASDGYGKAAHARSARPYPATHHPHRIFGTVGNTADPSPDAHTPAERARQAHYGVDKAFSVSRNSFVRFSSLQINSDSFTFILANTTNRVGFS